jgi:hypothetical protein
VDGDSARYSWTGRIATEPSPTADATRLTEPCRTSPTAKTPGKLVSNPSGVRRTVETHTAAVLRKRQAHPTTLDKSCARRVLGRHLVIRGFEVRVTGGAPHHTDQHLQVLASLI